MKTRDVEISFPNENEHSPCRILLFDRNKLNAVKNHLLNANEQKNTKEQYIFIDSSTHKIPLSKQVYVKSKY